MRITRDVGCRPSRRRALSTGLLFALLAGCGGEAVQPESQSRAAPTPAATEDPAAATEPGPEEEPSADVTVSLEGETLEFVVPYDAGGGYDVYARMIAPALEECTGGSVVVLNEPGAGGLAATTQTAVADPTGPRIQIINTVGAISAQVAESEGAQFDLAEFSWLGRVSAVPNVLLVAANSELQNFDDFRNAEEPVRFVSSGLGSNDHINAVVLQEIYDFPAEIIIGFAGAPEGRAAMLAGDADAQIAPADSAAQLIESGEVRAVLVIGETDDETLQEVTNAADVPTIGEEEQVVLDALLDLVETARSVTAPPDVPEERLAALRDAFECALTDEEFLATAEEQARPIDFLPGEEMAELVGSVLDAPPALQELLRENS
ncbi:MAG: hypothetical protein GEU81_12955 [Nitriliruptorales bacterium]|nr:hypothetical protein [Nitriliruptorales bacterium]